ncbi:hypothetical protein [Flaviaesturariibacter amylovorans]|uniref:Uncharacterized protein n=1 Tax=Flaviaesturariibacter amylovorans TaxID=1084520 RepID=A0ABP8GLL9_9BACT
MISVVTKPSTFSPSGNHLIWQVSSSDPNLVYFKVKVSEAESGGIINSLNIFPTPAYQNGSYIDLSKLLQNVVMWEVNTDSYLLVAPMAKLVRGYQIEITEVTNVGGVLTDGDVFTDDDAISYIFNAELGRIERSTLTQGKYVVNQSSTAQFLTGKPNYNKVNDINAEYLYFLQDGSFSNLYARVRTFDGSGSIVDSVTTALEDLDTYQAYRLNVSPKSMKDSSNLSFEGVGYYVVDIVDQSAIARSEERVYFYEEADCAYDYVNVLWINSLGGVDSYQFIAPQDTINVSRNSMKRNTHAINAEGVYSDQSGGIFNPSDVIISNNTTTTTRMVSLHLSDAEAYWLQELYRSKQVFVELGSGELVPAMLNGTSYQIPRGKYNRGSLNTMSIELTMADGVIPAGVTAYATTRSSIEFIDSQMNAIVLNIPGYGINPNTGRSYSTNYSQNYR